MNKTRVEVKQ